MKNLEAETKPIPTGIFVFRLLISSLCLLSSCAEEPPATSAEEARRASHPLDRQEEYWKDPQPNSRKFYTKEDGFEEIFAGKMVTALQRPH